jgi:hypothetical protein
MIDKGEVSWDVRCDMCEQVTDRRTKDYTSGLVCRHQRRARDGRKVMVIIEEYAIVDFLRSCGSLGDSS